MRFRPVLEAKRLRKARQGSVFVAGLLIAAFVSIPIVNLATPLFGMALMGARAQTADEPARRII
jgi:CysZ protein